VVVQTGDNYANEPGYPINVLPNQWTQVIVPLSAIGNPATIKRINIQDNSGAPQPTFYVDELCLSSTAAPPPPPPGCTLPVYLEALAPNWQNWSWNGTYNLAETAQALGSFSIGATIAQPYGGLSLRHDTGIPGSGYVSIVFWIHGGAAGTRQLQAFVQTQDTGGDTPALAFNAPAGQWMQVIVPLSALGNPSLIKRINIQDRSGAGQPTFYVDNVCLSSSLLPPLPPASAATRPARAAPATTLAASWALPRRARLRLHTLRRRPGRRLGRLVVELQRQPRPPLRAERAVTGLAISGGLCRPVHALASASPRPGLRCRLVLDQRR
jgi:hypothetical protein